MGYNRVVIKIGSSLFYSADGAFVSGVFKHIADEVSSLAASGKEVVIVSSGAIALGARALGLKARPRELSSLQAAASVGQNILMEHYSKAFLSNGLRCGQVLLTWEDFDNRRRYLNAKNTLATLLKLKCVPVINENDTVSTDEIKFGDNDRLSALVATLVSADLLIILSDVDGLWDRDKNIIPLVDEISCEIRALASPTTKKSCVGGMITKIEAARISVDSGITCVIANGRSKQVISCIVNGSGEAGTTFIPKKRSLAPRQRWIAFGTKPKGMIIVDDGAKAALLNNKSLLSVGVVTLEGRFQPGDVVRVLSRQGLEIARGKINLSHKELEHVLGKRHEKEVIHRDNIVILCNGARDELK